MARKHKVALWRSNTIASNYATAKGYLTGLLSATDKPNDGEAVCARYSDSGTIKTLVGVYAKDGSNNLSVTFLEGGISTVDGANFTGALQYNGSTVLTQADIVDGVTSTETDKVLSANQGKVLNDRIDNLSGMGRFLSGWDCLTRVM